MQSEPSQTRRQLLMIDAIDPISGKLSTVLMSHDRLMDISGRGTRNAMEAKFLVPHVLKKPTSIFEGLKRDEDDDPRGVGWRCYCGTPTCSYRTDGSEALPYHGKVYLVFVNFDGIAYNWRWEEADRTDPDLPIDYEERFKTRLL